MRWMIEAKQIANEHYPEKNVQIQCLRDVLDYESGRGWKLTVDLMCPVYLKEKENYILLYDPVYKKGLVISGTESRLHMEHPGEKPFAIVTGMDMVHEFYPALERKPLEMTVYYETRE